MLAGATVVDVVHGAKIGRFEPQIGVTDKNFNRAAVGGATIGGAGGSVGLGADLAWGGVVA